MKKIKQSKYRHRTAFSIIEILIALFLISCCLIPIMYNFSSAGSSIREIEQRNLIGTINTSFLETYRSQPYNRLKMLAGERELAVPKECRGQLKTLLTIKEEIKDKLISITVKTESLSDRGMSQTLAVLSANHHPAVGDGA